MRPGGFFPIYPDLTVILGRTDFDFENFYFLGFFGSRLGPGLGPRLGPELGPKQRELELSIQACILCSL